MTTIDTDRIALSHELSNLAERFAQEALNWKDVAARDNCARTARHLAQLSRSALGSLDIETGYAFADAGDLLARQVESARRFLLALDHKPVVPVMVRGRREGVIETLSTGRYRVTCNLCGSTIGTTDGMRIGYSGRPAAERALGVHRTKTHGLPL